MAEKKVYPRIQSKVIKRWKAKDLERGIKIYYCWFYVTWKMHAAKPPFNSYQAFVPISDVMDLENNVARYEKEYPAALQAEIRKMMESYPEERAFRDDYRMFLRKYGSTNLF